MTVLLVLFTLILFLIADHFVQKAKASAARAEAKQPEPLMRRRFPNDAILAVNHTWVRRDADGTATIGVDDFLGRLVGAVESIVLPGVGAMVTPATTDIALRKGKKALELSSPLLGRVVDVNPAIVKDPSLSRTDPYGKGWLMKVRPSPEHKDILLSYTVEKPAEWLAQQTERAKEFFRIQLRHGQLALMQDGGVPADGLLQECDAEVWKAFKDSFVALRHVRSNQPMMERPC